MTALQATDHVMAQLTLRRPDLRGLGRKLGVAVLPAAAVLFVILAGGHMHAFLDGVQRGLRVTPAWAALGVLFECVSLAAYVALLALVAGRATHRIGARESAQITLAGAAATRLMPTAGAGGLGVTVWALRRAGLSARSATKTLLSFLVVLYAAFLGALALAGGALVLGVEPSHGPLELSAVPAAAALAAIVLCLVLALRGGRDAGRAPESARLRRAKDAMTMLGEAVRDGLKLLRSGDARVAGAVAYWAFDAAVLWAMLHAVGKAPVLAVVVLAYFVGQIANTIPVPGSVSGGIAGVLIAFGVSAELALPAVLAYRAVSVWLPAPVAIASVPALRATVTRWSRAADAEPTACDSPQRAGAACIAA